MKFHNSHFDYPVFYVMYKVCIHRAFKGATRIHVLLNHSKFTEVQRKCSKHVFGLLYSKHTFLLLKSVNNFCICNIFPVTCMYNIFGSNQLFVSDNHTVIECEHKSR